MPTELQKAAVEKFVELNGKSVSRAMRESRLPYSPKTAKNPKNLTERKGWRILMTKYGLTEGLVTKALVEDIKSKPKNRLGELRLGSEILNMTEGEKKGDTYNQFNFFDVEQLKRIAERTLKSDDMGRGE